MSLSLSCPFHRILFGATLFGTLSLVYTAIQRYRLYNSIQRFEVDARFSETIKCRDQVYICGQVGEGENITEQTKSALQCVDKALAFAGCDKSKVLEVTIWLKDIDNDYKGMNAVYDQWIIPGKPPCRACIQAKLASPKYLVEVRVIAAAF